MELIGYLLAALVGLSLGLLGGGGSILTVPILVYVLGFAAKPAIAMSLPIVGITSLAGTIGHWRAGNVRLPMAITFGLIAMAGAFAGARFAAFLSGATQLTVLAVVMLAAAVAMLRGGVVDRATSVRSDADDNARAPVLLLGTATGVGFLTGMVGIGGGFLIVPALVLLARVPMKQAVGTSLVVIAMNSAAGFAGYFGRVTIPWPFVAAFTGVAVLGIMVGTALARFVPQTQLKRAFGVFLIGVGSFTLYQNRAVFRGSGAGAASVSAPGPGVADSAR